MKKTIALIFVMIILLALAVGCANDNKPGATSPAPTQSPPATQGDAAPGVGVRTGFGCDISIAKSKGASKDEQGNVVKALAQADVIMAAVTLDEQGTILGIKFDSAQVKINFDDKGALETKTDIEQQTKMELGDQYGMKQASGIGKEWYEQAVALEDWMKGKNIDEVLGMKTVERDASHPAVPDEPDLTSSVTISVDGFLRALEKAANNAGEAAVPSGATKTGLGCLVSIAKSKSAGTDANGNATEALAQADITMVAVTVDADGKILGVKIDQAQPKVNFSAQGELITDTATQVKTKVELADAYGMKQASGIGKEWYEQAAALEEWIKGKTIEQVMAMKTSAGDHPGAPDEADLTSSVTITVTDLLAAVQEAVSSAS